MYDRNGKLLVYNIPTFSVTLTPYEFRDETMPLLCKLIDKDSTEIRAILERHKSYSKFTPIKILRDVDERIIAQIEEASDKLFGINIAVDSKRIYNFKCNMAHLVGYLREITREQLEQKYQYYKLGDMIGQNGLEQKYELELHGSDGFNYVAFNKVGQRIDDFTTISRDIPARNGLSLNLTIDIGLQELAENLLNNRRGAVVAIDPNNGEILVCASKPDYHLSLFSGRVPAEIYNELRDDERKPLLPRA